METGRWSIALVALVALSWAGCVVGLEGPPPRSGPPVVVVAPPPPPPAPPPPEHVPPGQLRSAEVHERNAARKAAHDAEKARKHGSVADEDDDDDDQTDDPGHEHHHGRGHGDR